MCGCPQPTPVPMTLLARAICTTLLSVLVIALPARAELSDEIQVYTDDINEPGQFGLEMHVNTTPKGRLTPDHRAERVPDLGGRRTPERASALGLNRQGVRYCRVGRALSRTPHP